MLVLYVLNEPDLSAMLAILRVNLYLSSLLCLYLVVQFKTHSSLCKPPA